MANEALQELKEERESLSRHARGVFASIDRILKLIVKVEEPDEKHVTGK